MSEQLIIWENVIGNARDVIDAGFADLDAFTDVKAYGLVPPTRPKRFVRLMRAGGGQIDLVTLQPSIIAESWGRTDEDAEAIADRVHAIYLRAGRSGWFGAFPLRAMGILSAPQRLPDPVSGQHRYSAMYAPQLRGRVLA